MSNLRADGGIFKHGGPHEAYAVDNSAAYNNGVLGLNPVVAQCRTSCAARGKPTRRCVSRCIKRKPLLGLGQEESALSPDRLSEQMRVLTITTGLTGLLVAGLLMHQMISRA